MGDSISSKISRGGGGPSKKSISVYIYILIFMVFLCRRQMMLKLS